jgi:tRNA modification GTPase
MNYLNENETIAAISTPRGSGAISIVRISGKEAFPIAEKVFYARDNLTQTGDRKAVLGYITENGDKIDEVILLRYAAPNSYTGEDIVEIDCHGGTYVTAKILDIIVAAGARTAEPGEFTKRAFLNGRIDLMQAEAVQDLISAKSSRAGSAALHNLEGRVSCEIKSIKEELTEMLANIEVQIDFPEYDYEALDNNMLTKKLARHRNIINTLINSYKKGNIYKNGVRIVIAGRPNVGKSTFLNTFIGKNRAIVTDIPGTTRDTIEEYLELDGIPVTLTDTAGLRETENIIEKIGQEKTKEAIKEAEIILLILDPKDGISKEDEDVLRQCKGKNVIMVLNKTDTVDEARLKELEAKIKHSCVARTSLISGTGIDEVERIIKEILGIGSGSDANEAIISQSRQKEILLLTDGCILKSMTEIDKGVPLDIIEIEIKRAAEYLGELLGENVNEEITDKIFSRFCLGK